MSVKPAFLINRLTDVYAVLWTIFNHQGKWLPSLFPSSSCVHSSTVGEDGYGAYLPSVKGWLGQPRWDCLPWLHWREKNKARGCGIWKAGIGYELVWLLEGADHFLSRTDELPRTVIMKHANASWGTLLQTALSTCLRRNFEQSDARQIVLALLFPFRCKCRSYLLEKA